MFSALWQPVEDPSCTFGTNAFDATPATLVAGTYDVLSPVLQLPYTNCGSESKQSVLCTSLCLPSQLITTVTSTQNPPADLLAAAFRQ